MKTSQKIATAVCGCALIALYACAGMMAADETRNRSAEVPEAHCDAYYDSPEYYAQLRADVDAESERFGSPTDGMYFSTEYVADMDEEALTVEYTDVDAGLENCAIPVNPATFNAVRWACENNRIVCGELRTLENGVYGFVPDEEF